jgi:hypothetical protein
MPNEYKKIVPVKYTSREFNSIKEELIEYAKRYYPTTFRDFSEASFGALMVDTVSYVGDMLSFYMDYQANESFIDTAIEYENVVSHARRLGYRYRANPTSYGVGTFFVLIPATSLGTPDVNYMPVIKKGSLFSSDTGNQYMLNEDIETSSDNNEIVVARVSEDTGLPTWFAIKTTGQLISGFLSSTTVDLGNFKKFRRIEITAPDVAEITDIVDSEGHSYHEVDYLSQNVVYKAVKNPNFSGADGQTQHLLKPFIVPRRFTVEQVLDRTFIQFGYGSDSELTSESVADPSSVVLQQWGKDHITDESFDPSKLLKTEKFGIAPANTTLTIIYRVNSSEDVNAPVDSVTEVIDPILQFKNVRELSQTTISFILQNIEVSNEEPIIGDINTDTISEIKLRAKDNYASQARAVTRQDYISTVYSMPSKFGAVKRCNILRDHNALKRNLNLHIVSENRDGSLVRTNDGIKSNLKVWLGKNKMINDTIDILDARILNLSIEFSVLGDATQNRYDILNRAKVALARAYSVIPDVSEPFYITDVRDILKSVQGVVDVIDVQIRQKSGGDYADLNFDVDRNTSPDGRMIKIPEDVIWEIKYPNIDIKGVVK